MRRRGGGSDGLRHEAGQGLGVEEVALDLVAPPAQALEALARDRRRLDLRPRIAIDQLDRRQVGSHEAQRLVVLTRLHPRRARPRLDHGALPEEASGQQLPRRVVQRAGPGAEDVEVRVVLQVEDAGRVAREHDVGVRQDPQRIDEARPLVGRRQHVGLIEDHAQLPRLDRVHNDLGVRGDDELGLLPARRRAQLAVDRVLEDHVQVRVGLVQQQHRARASLEEREQHEHLLKPAAGACDVEPRPARPLPILRQDVSAGGVGRHQLEAEEPSDGVLQAGPRGLRVGGLDEEIAEDVAGLGLAQKLIDLRALIEWLLGSEPAHGGNEDR